MPQMPQLHRLHPLHRLWAALVLLTVWAMPARGQVAVVTVKSFDDAMADARYVMKLAGQEERFKQLEGLIESLNDGKGLKGLDPKRPLGAYVHLPAAAGGMPRVVAFLPITKEDEFLELLKSFNVEAEKPEQGVYTLNAPNGEKYYLRFAHRYAFGSDNADNLAGNLPDPVKLAPAAARDYLVAASFRVAELPREVKQQFLDEVARGIEAEQEKKPGETDAEYQGRLAGMKMAQQALTALVEDTQDVTLGLAVDQKKRLLALDVALTARTGSKLAASIKNFGEGRSVFSAWARDAALSILLHIPLAEDLQKQFAKLFEEGFKEGLKQIEDPQQRELAEKMLKTLQDSFRGDAIDLGAALRGPFDDKKYALVAGLRVKDGKKLEQLIKDLVKDAPAGERDKIKLDSYKIGNDSVHVIEADKPDEKAEQLFGKTDIHVVFREGMMVAAIGEHGRKALTEALSAIDKGGAKAAAPVQVELSVARLAQLGGDMGEQLQEIAKKVFQGEDKDKDKVRLLLQGGDSLKLRVEMDAPVVKLIGELLAPLLGGE